MTPLVDPAVVERLRERAIPFAVIGAVALARHGAPRYSADVDLMAMTAEVLRADFWIGCAPPAELRGGHLDDALTGVVRWVSPRPLDLIVGRGRAMAFAVESSAIDGELGLPVVTPLGLTLLKLEAGGPQDRYDILSLVNAQLVLTGAPWLAELQAHSRLLSHSAHHVLDELRQELTLAVEAFRNG